jgi:hypothetical protein
MRYGVLGTRGIKSRFQKPKTKTNSKLQISKTKTKFKIKVPKSNTVYRFPYRVAVLYL